MQANDVVEDQTEAQKIWLEARDSMLSYVQRLSDLGVHKQHANRLLEPFQHITVVASATDWSNFFALRCHKDAQPEFQELAKAMYSLYTARIPKVLELGEWHLPFVTPEERLKFPIDDLITMSVARCARVSYNTHDGTEQSLEKDKDEEYLDDESKALINNVLLKLN